MTGHLGLDLLISLGGVAAMIALSLALGALRTARVSEAAAREILALDEPDFRPGPWHLSEDGRAGFSVDVAAAEMALVVSHGDRLAVRRLPLGRVVAAKDGPLITLDFGDVAMRRRVLRAPDAATADLWLGLIGAGR